MEQIITNNESDTNIIFLVTNSEARNLIQGLELLYGKCIDNMQSISPLDLHGTEMKKYYRAKQEELANQISIIRKAITGKPLHHVTSK